MEAQVLRVAVELDLCAKVKHPEGGTLNSDECDR